jgi:hypothetical protein
MHRSRRSLLSLVLALLALCLAAPAALAAGPAPVTVRVEGLNETLLGATPVTTSEEPVVKDGNPNDACSGTSALGALQLATAGNWSGPWEASFHQYFIEAIKGESHPYQQGVTSYYWSFWLNDRFEESGPCEVQMEAGDRVLFFPLCDEACPAGAAPTPLEIAVTARAQEGEDVTAIVSRYDEAGEPSPAAGARIEWNGGSATANAQGDATLKFTATGSFTLHVSEASSGPPAMRTEAVVCVHNGDDGNCATTRPSTSQGNAPTEGAGHQQEGSALAQAPLAYKGPYALVADVQDIANGRIYTAADAPRLISGTIRSHSAVDAVKLELRREYRGRCYAYDGIRERFVRARCGSASTFTVSNNGSFSYLLPERLKPGRYVLDVHASDVAGNVTTLARGSSRLVFYVR